jgi:glycosyltransferase involved in cell wall biosynthesis
MRIGIDATALPQQPVGAGNYMINLVRALSGQESEFEFAVFLQRSGREQIGLEPGPRLEYIVVTDRSPAQRLLWEQIAFPRLVVNSGAELLHSLHYTRPYRLNCPSVVTFHDMTFFLFPGLHTRIKRYFFPLAIRMSARRAQALIAVSENTRQDAIRLLGLPPDRITTTPLGVDVDFRPCQIEARRQAVQEKYHLPAEFILYVGLIEPRKNLPLLIRAYKSMLESGREIALVLGGRFGWDSGYLIEEISAFGLQDRVHFTGYISREDLPIVYNLASLFVYPTRYEGFGLPVLEALACGTPTITSAVASLPEIAGDAVAWVPPGDEQALAQTMSALLADQAWRQQLAVKGPVQAAQFTWNRTAQLTLQVYRRVLSVSRKL